MVFMALSFSSVYAPQSCAFTSVLNINSLALELTYLLHAGREGVDERLNRSRVFLQRGCQNRALLTRARKRRAASATGLTGAGLLRSNVELTGPLRWDDLAREQKMYCVPAPGPRWPAVEGPVECRVRPRWREEAAPAHCLNTKTRHPASSHKPRRFLGWLDEHGWVATSGSPICFVSERQCKRARCAQKLER